MTSQTIEQGTERWLVVTLGRRLDALNAPEIPAALQPFVNAGGRRVIFDCASLQYASSAGLREFIAAAKKMKSLAGSCAFAAPTPAVSQLFSLSGLTGLLELRDSVAAAQGVRLPAAAEQPSAPPAPTPASGLSLAEEVTLLGLDDQHDRWLSLPDCSFYYALAGAIVADLALAGRVDTDLDCLTVIDSQPTGNALLDPWLQQMALTPKKLPVSGWLDRLVEESDHSREAALGQLVQKGVLRREEKRILWVIALRRYPPIDGHERVEVRTRLRELILGGELPDPRDAMLIGLLHGCAVLEKLLGLPEFEKHAARIQQLARMELVGRSAAAAAKEAIVARDRAIADAMMRG